MVEPIIDIEKLKEIDKNNMFSVLEDFPVQIQHALQISESIVPFQEKPKNILVLGMGGSAIGGDLVRSYLQNIPELNKLNIVINRSYNIPSFIDNNWAIIASSYSGNTEETLSGLNQALKVTKNIVCITTGGKLEEIASEKNLNTIKVPVGLQPRCALGYSFFIILKLIQKTFVVVEADKIINSSIMETQMLLERKSAVYTQIDENNPAIELATKLQGKIPAIYSSSDITDVVNIRWRGQIQENSKNLAFGGFLPEANHNDICGWVMPDDLQERFTMIFLKDELDNERVKLRFEALDVIYKSMGKEILEFSGKGHNLLTRIFDLIYFGDWLSYYLAILNHTDPTPIPLISQLKKYLDNA